MQGTPDLTFGERLKVAVASWLLLVWLRLTAWLCPLDAIEGEEHMDRFLKERQPIVLCLWHNRLVYLTWWISSRFKKAGVESHSIVSRSKDGEIMARVATKMGFRLVRGSSSRGGAAGLLTLGRRMRRGGSVATVGDGPRGPRYVLKPGPAALAKISGAPVVPIAYSAEKAWFLDSWDRLIIPKPTSKLALVIGEPFFVSGRASDEELEEAIAELERCMEAVRRRADELAGVSSDRESVA